MISFSCTIRTLPAVDGSGLPQVPLEAGIGPDNPPCPACGEPLFGWVAAPGPGAPPVRRCEACGLGVVGEEASPEEALRALFALPRAGEALLFENRASLQAWIGARVWAALAPGSRFLFTPEAVRRLAAERDETPRRARWQAGAGIAGMWQTLLNVATFGRNVGLGWLGIAPAEPARTAWQRRLDALITAVLALPILVVAVPLEAAAALFGRGGTLSLRLMPP
jgi:hypothetical protein